MNNSVTIDRLVRLLDEVSERAANAERVADDLRRQMAEYPYAPADANDLARLLAGVGGSNGGSKLIYAIKIFRQFTGLNLKESKDAIERYWKHEGAS